MRTKKILYYADTAKSRLSYIVCHSLHLFINKTNSTVYVKCATLIQVTFTISFSFLLLTNNFLYIAQLQK